MTLQNNTLRRSRNGGSVIILTLWAVVFLALLALAISTNVMGHFRVASDLKWGLRSRAFGMRAMAAAVDILKSDDMLSYDTLFESWASGDSNFKDVSFGEGTFSIFSDDASSASGEIGKRYGLSDEEGKISLNLASQSVLSFLLREAGMTAVRAEELAKFIVDWRDVNTTAEGSLGSEACAAQSIPLACKNAPFEAMEELWWMPGMTQSIYDAIKGQLTLYGSGAVNINTAGAIALRSVGLSANGVDRITQWRSSSNFFKDSSEINSRAAEIGISEEDRAKLGSAVGSGYLGTRSEFFRGNVEATLGGQTRKVASFIINREGKLQWWRE